MPVSHVNKSLLNLKRALRLLFLFLRNLTVTMTIEIRFRDTEEILKL